METKLTMCADCSKEFSLTPGEVEFYTGTVSDDGKPMVVPKRCSACRRRKRDMRDNK